jgi:hypothetical protein
MYIPIVILLIQDTMNQNKHNNLTLDLQELKEKNCSFH